MILLFGLLTAALVTPSAESSILCGRPYENITQLRKELEGDDNVAHFPAKAGLTTFFDRKAMTLWWIYSQRGNGSVVSCKHKVATVCGYIDGRVETDCNGNANGLCAAQVERMISAKF